MLTTGICHYGGRIPRAQTVAEALLDNAWARDIGPDLELDTIQEYLQLWSRISALRLQQSRPDVVTWSSERGGIFSVRAAYAARFVGRKVAPTKDFSWKTRAPCDVVCSRGLPFATGDGRLTD